MDGRVFLFAANPDHWDVREQLKQVGPGHIEEWAANQNRAKMRTGDIVLLWSFMGAAKVESGIYAIGRIVAPPRKHASKHGKYAVWWVVTEVLASPISKDSIIAAAGLEKSTFAKPMQGTNFLLGGAESKALLSAFPQLMNGTEADPITVAVGSIVEDFGLQEKSQKVLSDPDKQAWLAIRRYRVAQIQTLFKAGPIEWQKFQKDVWPIGGIKLDDQTYTFLDNHSISLDEVTRQIDDDILECHGNSLWAPASGVFAPLSTPEERIAGVEKLRQILISDATPDDKYTALKKISGLGPSVSSGFLALFHPDSWALRNGPTIAVFDRLHLDSSESGFQRSAAALKEALGATDFLELDIILFQLPGMLPSVQPNFWWVNLRQSLEELQAQGRLQANAGQDDAPEDEKDLLRLSPGDVIYAHRNQNLVAKLKVISVATQVAAADEEQQGRFEVAVQVEPYGPVALESVVTAGPAFDKSGKPLPGYLFPMLSDLEIRPKPTISNEKVFLKVSPWIQAKLWDKCREHSCMLVGWNAVGDLSNYQNVNELRVAMANAYSPLGKDSGFNQFAEDLWAYKNLRPGDVIIANKGRTQVLGIGVVQAPGYLYRPELDLEAPHFMPVEWDLSFAKTIPRQTNWGQTISRFITDELKELIIGPTVPTPSPKSSSNAQAMILYGPPGTGKTFVTRRRAVDLAQRVPMLGSDLATVFSELSAGGRIRFITFHQSFGYEEFVEGIRPLANDEDQAVSFEVQPGVFAKIAMTAAAAGVKKVDSAPTFESLWSEILDEIQTQTVEDGHYWIDAPGDRRYLASTTGSGNIHGNQWRESDGIIKSSGAYLTANKTYARALWSRRDELGEAYSSKLVSKIVGEELGTAGGCHPNLLWWANQRLQELADNAMPKAAGLAERLEIAQDLLEGRPAEGEFDFDGADQFVLIIDEINRGNISKILGELITLLEPSKRLTKDDELIVRLPYSGRAFGVPPNLHVIGTMNTADRSIALLDVALRRRFMFEEVMPDAQVIRDVLPDRVEDQVDDPDAFVDLVVQVFDTINKRVQFLYDRDHMIGHAYYLQATNYAAFRDVMLKSVIPLLKEYFYGSWDLVCTALGCPYHEDGNARRSSTGYAYPIVQNKRTQTADVLGFEHEDFEDKLVFGINPHFQNEDTSDEDLELFFKGIL